MPNTKPVTGNVNNPKKGILNPVTITIAAPNEAPEDTPNVYEEARGFFKTDCITEPLTATAPPTKNAKSVLGSLNFHIIDIAVVPSISERSGRKYFV